MGPRKRLHRCTRPVARARSIAGICDRLSETDTHRRSLPAPLRRGHTFGNCFAAARWPGRYHVLYARRRLAGTHAARPDAGRLDWTGIRRADHRARAAEDPMAWRALRGTRAF